MASSAFQLLSMGGASFNKQKYKKDLDLFSGKVSSVVWHQDDIEDISLILA
jgi:hypothetical protein